MQMEYSDAELCIKHTGTHVRMPSLPSQCYVTQIHLDQKSTFLCGDLYYLCLSSLNPKLCLLQLVNG